MTPAYYKGRRTRNLYDPASYKPFAISRSKIDLFHNCPRCFYLDRRLGVGQPPGYPFNLNSAVDALLKNEFDHYRALQQPHPLMVEYGIEAVPFQHEALDEWRENFKGVRVHHQPTNLLVTGAVDDVWTNADGQLIVVDYKSTAKKAPVTIDAPWQIAYKRQMETYQWLLRGLGFEVASTGYFVYANGQAGRPTFDCKLEFEVSVLPYAGDASWVEDTLQAIKAALDQEHIPQAGSECDFCVYRAATRSLEAEG